MDNVWRRALRTTDFTSAEVASFRKRLAVRSVADPATGCVNWIGHRVPRGYGQFKIGGRSGYMVYVHRLAYALAFGEVPGDRSVLHRCDNPRCCKPEHLFLGTHQENVDDMIAKRRHRFGEASHKAKLTADQVRFIVQSDCPGKSLAAQFGVSRAAISLIKSGKKWKLHRS